MNDVLARNNVHTAGSGPLLVYAHGFGCNQHMWDRVTPAFAGTHRQVLFDYVGSGRSQLNAYSPARYATLEGYAQDLIEVCEATGQGERATVVAHSVSCSIALLAAAARPELFKDLILLGPNPCFINEQPDYVGGFERADLEGLLALMDQNYLGWANYLAPVVAGEGGGESVAGELSSSFCSTDPVVARQFAAATFFADNRKDLERVKTRSLVLQHRHDTLAPIEVGRYLASHLPDCTLEVLDVAGHCAHMSHPEMVVSAMRRRLGA
jgi:sigma-B regulation protein RsbQ